MDACRKMLDVKMQSALVGNVRELLFLAMQSMWAASGRQHAENLRLSVMQTEWAACRNCSVVMTQSGFGGKACRELLLLAVQFL